VIGSSYQETAARGRISSTNDGPATVGPRTTHKSNLYFPPTAHCLLLPAGSNRAWKKRRYLGS